MKDVQNMALQMRRNIIELARAAGSNGAHLGSALSIVEIMAVLYSKVLKLHGECRDRFILSKGHGSLGLYTALNKVNIISDEKLSTYEANGGDLPGQPCLNESIGIEMSSGSLGLGLSFGIGCVVASKLKGLDYKAYVLMGDGELNEGSVWEAVMFAGHHKLSNLIAIIDANGMQSDGTIDDILSFDYTVFDKFGWDVIWVDGHNIQEIYKAFASNSDKPRVIVAKTVKGKGISFMESNNEWHHNVLTDAKYKQAMNELNEVV